MKSISNFFKEYIASQDPSKYIEELNEIAASISSNPGAVIKEILKCSENVKSPAHRLYLWICIFELLHEDPIYIPWISFLHEVKNNKKLRWILEFINNMPHAGNT